MLKRILCALCLAVVLAMGAGCESEGPAEKAGKQIDQTMEEMQDKAGDMAEEAGDALEEAGDKAEEAADEAEDKME